MRYVMMIGVFALTACTPGDGERCNPLQFSDQCKGGEACVYPTAPSCGVAYCCAVDSSGKVVDSRATCQPDSTLSCAPDLSLSTGD